MHKERLVLPSEDEPIDLGAGPSRLTYVYSWPCEGGLRAPWQVVLGRSRPARPAPANAVCADVADEAEQVLYELRFDVVRRWQACAFVRFAMCHVRPEVGCEYLLLIPRI